MLRRRDLLRLLGAPIMGPWGASHRRQARRRLKAESARQQRGQSLVEVSMVQPLLFFLLFAIIEGSFLVLSIETANFAAQAAETVLAQAGQDPTADAQALLAIRSTALGQTRLADVQEIDFERVNSLGSPLGSINRSRLDGTPIGILGTTPSSRNVQEPRLSPGQARYPIGYLSVFGKSGKITLGLPVPRHS